NGCQIGLRHTGDVAEPLGAAPESEHEHTGGHRVEGSGMADLLRPVPAAHASDRGVRTQSLRLIPDEDALWGRIAHGLTDQLKEACTWSKWFAVALPRSSMPFQRCPGIQMRCFQITYLTLRLLWFLIR